MARCKLCGKKLKKGEECGCQNTAVTAEEKEAAVPTPVKKKSKVLRWIIAISIIIAVIAAAVTILISANAYKDPVEDTVKGINRGDYERILNAMYTEEYVGDIQKNAEMSGLSWEDYLKKNDKAVEAAIDGLGIRKVKAEIIAKEKMSGSNFERIENYYEDRYNADVRKAYRVEVEFTIKEKGQKLPQKGWLCVVKVKDEGWKLCAQKSDSRFDFIDAVVGIGE